MNKDVIEETHVTGEEIFAIIEAMGPILDGVPASHAIIACLSIAVTLQDPDLTQEDIRAGVKGASEWICTFLSCRDNTSPLVVN